MQCHVREVMEGKALLGVGSISKIAQIVNTSHVLEKLSRVPEITWNTVGAVGAYQATTLNSAIEPG